jgi:GcrA cell cycle regulator
MIISMKKNPLDLTMEQLANAAEAASLKADAEAKVAGVDVAGELSRAPAEVLSLGGHMCKWPVGDPSSDEFSYCRRRTQGDGPYCAEHAQAAYSPQRVRAEADSSPKQSKLPVRPRRA